MFQEFLMLDEIVRSKAEPPLVGKTDAAVVIQDLVCYWDKVRPSVGALVWFRR